MGGRGASAKVGEIGRVAEVKWRKISPSLEGSEKQVKRVFYIRGDYKWILKKLN